MQRQSGLFAPALAFGDRRDAELDREGGRWGLTDVFSPVGGSKASAGIIDFIAKGSIDPHSYDPRTGRGKTSFTLYIHTGDNGVGCKGANHVKPKAVEPDSHGTEDFTAGEEPALHLDTVITSLTAVAGNYGGFVLGSTLYIQNK